MRATGHSRASMSSIYDGAVRATLAIYSSTRFVPPKGRYTVLAAVILVAEDHPPKVVSLATGAKCLPLAKFPKQGDALHDSHAEVLARRGAVRWLLEEIARAPASSQWLVQAQDIQSRWTLRAGVKLVLYISTLPCGDASTRWLAAQQDAAMAALKDAAPPIELPANSAARGRDGYARLGVLRTKPGRADSPPTTCMSCSDKIAQWVALGIQGALGSTLLEPLRPHLIIIGGVSMSERAPVAEDCARAFWERVGAGDAPELVFTDVTFPHERTPNAPATGHESLCWVADCGSEVLHNGTRRGVTAVQRTRPSAWPMLCRARMFALWTRVYETVARTQLSPVLIYTTAKRIAEDYHAAKARLRSPGAPFSGWVVAGDEWSSFIIPPDAEP